jgi:hypothetical protein
MYKSVEEIRTIVKEKIPNGLIVPQHTDSGHFYLHSPSGNLFASVTTKCGILDSPHLKKWASKLAVEHMLKNVKLLQEGADINARIKMCEQAILVHQDQFEQAGDVGTRGHAVVEDYLMSWINGVKPKSIKDFVPKETVDSRIVAIARSAEMFCNDFNIIPIASEMKVASSRYKFGGTLDSLMMVFRTVKKGNGSCAELLNLYGEKGREHDFLPLSSSNPNKVKCLHCGLSGVYEFAIVDWKTSNSIDKVEYAMQTSAYWQAVKEMTGLKPKRIYVVRLDKTQAKYEVRVLTDRVASFRAFRNATKIYDWLNDGNEKLVNAFPRQIVTLDSLSINNPEL